MANWVVGLTGGIGSGKSSAAKYFAQLGVPLVDDDQIARQLVEPGQPALEAIARHFGQDILRDGQLDRPALRKIIFADPEQRRWLEGLLHPLVRQKGQCQLAEAQYPYAILMSPLLIETGRYRKVNRVLVVDAPVEQQIARIVERDGVERQQAEAIINAQISREERLAKADDVLVNDQDLALLAQQVERQHEFYLGLINQ